MSTDLRTFRLNREQQKIISKVEDRLSKAQKHAIYVSVYSSQLEGVLGTLALSGSHELHIYSLLHLDYHLGVAAAAAKLMDDADSWTIPMMIVLYNNSQKALDFILLFNDSLKQLQNSIETHKNEPWYGWAQQAVKKAIEWGSDIGTLTLDAIKRIEELLGPEKLQEIQLDINQASEMVRQYRLQSGLHLTSTIGLEGLRYLPTSYSPGTNYSAGTSYSAGTNYSPGTSYSPGTNYSPGTSYSSGTSYSPGTSYSV